MGLKQLSRNFRREDRHKDSSNEESFFLLPGKSAVNLFSEAKNDKRAKKGRGVPGTPHL